MSKPTISKDGQLRADLKVNFRLGIEQLTALFLAHHRSHADLNASELKRKLETLTKREILEDVRKELFYNGTRNLNSLSAPVEHESLLECQQLMRARFPEFNASSGQTKAIELFGLNKEQ